MNAGYSQVNEDSAWFVIVATSVYITVVAIGTITVSLFLAVLIKGHSIFKEFPFFTIVWNLTLVNAASVIIQCTCICPTMFIDYDENSRWKKWYDFGTEIVTLSETATAFLVLLIAINRFSVLVFKKLAFAFSKKNIKYPLILTWAAIFTICYFRLFYMTSYKKFSKENFEFTDFFLIREGFIYTFVSSVSYIIPASVFLMYLMIYLYLQKKRSTLNTGTDDNNNDRSLLLQGFLLSISIIIWRTLTTLSPRVNDGWLQYILVMLKALASVLNNIINPLLFLTTNTTVRKTLMNLIKCESMNPKITSENDIPTARPPNPRFRLKIKNPLKKRVVVEPVVILSTMDQIEQGIVRNVT